MSRLDGTGAARHAVAVTSAPEMKSRSLRSISGGDMAGPRFTWAARALHWIIAFLVLGQIALGLASDNSREPLSIWLLDKRVQIGLLIFALMILRLLWRMTHRPPPFPAAIAVWQRVAAAGVHRLLYILLLLMPVSGYVLWVWIGRPLSWFGLIQIPILFESGDDETWRSIAGYAHEYSAYVLIALLITHIGAALFHEFILRDHLIRDRML